MNVEHQVVDGYLAVVVEVATRNLKIFIIDAEYVIEHADNICSGEPSVAVDISVALGNGVFEVIDFDILHDMIRTVGEPFADVRQCGGITGTIPPARSILCKRWFGIVKIVLDIVNQFVQPAIVGKVVPYTIVLLFDDIAVLQQWLEEVRSYPSAARLGEDGCLGIGEIIGTAVLVAVSPVKVPDGAEEVFRVGITYILLEEIGTLRVGNLPVENQVVDHQETGKRLHIHHVFVAVLVEDGFAEGVEVVHDVVESHGGLRCERLFGEIGILDVDRLPDGGTVETVGLVKVAVEFYEYTSVFVDIDRVVADANLLSEVIAASVVIVYIKVNGDDVVGSSGTDDARSLVSDGGSRDLGTSRELINNVIIPNLGEDKENRILVAINQCDMAMKGRNWNYETNEPEPKLVEFLDQKVSSIQERIYKDTGVDITPIYYCAGYKEDESQVAPYNLSKLLHFLVKYTPEEKRFGYIDRINEDPTVWQHNDGGMDYVEETERNFWSTAKNVVLKGTKIVNAIAPLVALIPGPIGRIGSKVVNFLKKIL